MAKKRPLRSTFTFRLSWWTAMKKFTQERKFRILEGIFTYAENGDTPTDLDAEDKTIFDFVRNEIDAETPKRKKKTVDANPTTLAQAIDEAEKAPLHNRGHDLFLKYYKETTGEDYYFNGRDAGNLKTLLSMLRFARRQKGLSTDDDGILEAFSYLLHSIRDPWILDNLSLGVVLSKYNAIINQAKNYGNIGAVNSDKRRANEAVIRALADDINQDTE